MDLAGFAIQDMTKGAAERVTPKLTDLSGGAKVRFGADWVFIIILDPNTEGLYYLVPAKQRDGDRGKKPIPLTRNGLPFVNAVVTEVNLREVN
jgi:hypothetical protein